MQFKTLSYPTLAFEFQYPVTTESGRKLPVIISRKPERYSSAAPMTADARQRIVAELVDFPDGITISVSVRTVKHFMYAHMQSLLTALMTRHMLLCHSQHLMPACSLCIEKQRRASPVLLHFHLIVLTFPISNESNALGILQCPLFCTTCSDWNINRVAHCRDIAVTCAVASQ